MSVSREDLFCLRLPLVDVREQAPEDPWLFRQFDLYLIRAQAEYLIFLAHNLRQVLDRAPREDDPEPEETP